MSTYGKNALIKWDYISVDGVRFNHSAMDVQASILEKWYPIGMEVNIFNTFSKTWSDSDRESNIYLIIKYQKNLSHHMIEVKNSRGVTLGLHPKNIKPTQNWVKVNNREDRLNDLLGG